MLLSLQTNGAKNMHAAGKALVYTKLILINFNYYCFEIIGKFCTGVKANRQLSTKWVFLLFQIES
jgi:hypothetical protein